MLKHFIEDKKMNAPYPNFLEMRAWLRIVRVELFLIMIVEEMKICQEDLRQQCEQVYGPLLEIELTIAGFFQDTPLGMR